MKQIRHKVTRPHVIQSLIGGAFILLVFGSLSLFESELSVASLAASTFIVFSFPKAKVSRPRYLIGGYAVGILVGLVCGALVDFFPTFYIFTGQVMACALAVFLAMLLMTVFNFEHPPSAALAVAIVTSDMPLVLGVSALLCVMVLCTLAKLLTHFLCNL